MTRRLIEVLLTAALLVLLLTVGFPLGWGWWVTDRRVQSTDDAYVQGDLRTLGAKVPGYVTKVPVADFATVAAGQPIVLIEDDDYRAKVKLAESVVQARNAAIANVDALIRQQQNLIDQAAAQIAPTRANLELARVERNRARSLLRSTYGTQAALDKAEAAFQAASATLRNNEAALAGAKGQLAVLATGRRQAEADLGQAQASLTLARIDLEHTVIRAPVRGQLGRRAVLEGQYVAAGSGVIALTPMDTVWIAANFKETQLTRVQGGQPVTVTVDTFPGIEVKGTVAAVAPASGSATALLPPDNATGNFTKIVQRVPVKVALEPGHALGGQLRPGMSTIVSIDTGTPRATRQVGVIDRLLATLGLGHRGAIPSQTLAVTP